jgi:predicted Zn-dependent protease
MAESAIHRFEAMLSEGRDSALLRFSLGNEYLKLGEPDRAAAHLAVAVSLDPHYSAAWKLLGRAQLEAGKADAAREAWQRGIEVAEARGDKQAAKEMQVFLKRLV